MFNKVLVFCGLLAFASAFVEIAELEVVPPKFNGQKGCYIKELDTMVSLENSIPSKERCVEYRCTTTKVIINGCSAVYTGESSPCYVEEDKSKPYPLCCPTQKC